MNSSTSTNETAHCVTLDSNATSSDDNTQDLISSTTFLLLVSIKGGVISPVLFIIGAPSNLINMVVFFKQGLNERINLCLFLLAVSDLGFLTFIVIYSFTRTDVPFTKSGEFGDAFSYMTNNNLIGFYGLSYVSTLLSTVIAIERCACVFFPLQVQRCVRTKSFAGVLIFSLCVVGFLRFVVTAKYLAVCFYEVRTGRTLYDYTVSGFYIQNKASVDALDGTFFGFCLSMGCPLVVLIATASTAAKLHQIVRWRDHASSTISSKEIGVTRMLISLSVEFLVLSIPILFVRILPMFGTEVRVDGLYKNTFLTLVSIAEVSVCIGSSVNFFVYYCTGSRYRETLHQLLCWKSSG